MTELFMFGTIWFWILSVVAAAILMSLTENEEAGGATICLVVYCAILQWMGGINILGFIRHYPLYFFLILLSYFLIGTLWGVARWAIFVKNRSQELVELIRDFCNQKKVTYTNPLDPEIWTAFKKNLENSTHSSKYTELLTAPRIRDHKERFISWLSFWPASMIYTLFDDAIRNICRQIYLTITNRLQAISDGIYRRNLPK